MIPELTALETGFKWNFLRCQQGQQHLPNLVFSKWLFNVWDFVPPLGNAALGHPETKLKGMPLKASVSAMLIGIDAINDHVEKRGIDVGCFCANQRLGDVDDGTHTLATAFDQHLFDEKRDQWIVLNEEDPRLSKISGINPSRPHQSVVYHTPLSPD
jgi:hypothetical protein